MKNSLLKKFIPNSLKKYLVEKIVTNLKPNEVIHLLNNTNWKLSFSQEGEDLILNRYFEGKKNGFFIDVGAHHPIRFSNTYLFYRKGWRGINIDAMPGSMNEFNMIRIEDINIEQAIGYQEAEATFHIFNEPALNTFDNTEAENVISSGMYKLKEKVSLSIKPIGNVLDQHQINSSIDFMSIDVEGLDLDVLRGNNWEKYRPEVILIELLNFELEEAERHETVIFLKSVGYKLFAKTFNTVFFKLIN
jgi:FkbM family methyltransferase